MLGRKMKLDCPGIVQMKHLPIEVRLTVEVDVANRLQLLLNPLQRPERYARLAILCFVVAISE